MTVNGFEKLASQTKHWDECGRRLHTILSEVSSRIGGPALYFDENGKFFAHQDLTKKLDEPGNEELRDYLLFMQRSGIAVPD
jgi:hypothetical protein